MLTYLCSVKPFRPNWDADISSGYYVLLKVDCQRYRIHNVSERQEESVMDRQATSTQLYKAFSLDVEIILTNQVWRYNCFPLETIVTSNLIGQNNHFEQL